MESRNKTKFKEFAASFLQHFRNDPFCIFFKFKQTKQNSNKYQKQLINNINCAQSSQVWNVFDYDCKKRERWQIVESQYIYLHI